MRDLIIFQFTYNKQLFSHFFAQSFFVSFIFLIPSVGYLLVF